MDDSEFLSAATGIVNDLERELRRVKPEERGSWRAIEIGCSSGRLMRPMSRHFVEIHGVDASAEAIALARENLRDLPNVHLHFAADPGLPACEDDSLDFVYSLGAPFASLLQIRRILRTGGLARLRFQSLERNRAELLEFAHSNDFQVLAIDSAGPQSMWTTWRKQPDGWSASAAPPSDAADLPVIIRRITNASSTEPVAPCRGRFASISIRTENLPPDSGLVHLRVTVGSSLATVTYVGSLERGGGTSIHADLPELEATGLLPVQIFWLDQPLSVSATLRVIPPGPSVPRLVFAPRRVENRTLKMIVEEVARPHEMEVSMGGQPVADLEFACTDPRPQRFELTCRLPETIGPGLHHVRLRIGRRKLAPVPVEVVG